MQQFYDLHLHIDLVKRRLKEAEHAVSAAQLRRRSSITITQISIHIALLAVLHMI